jgi:hypothetical protein
LQLTANPCTLRAANVRRATFFSADRFSFNPFKSP